MKVFGRHKLAPRRRESALRASVCNFQFNVSPLFYRCERGHDGFSDVI